MGVPRLLASIIKKNPATTFWDSDLNVDHLFLDFNAMIYSIIIILSKEIGLNNNSSVQFESLLLPRIIKHLEYVINDVIRPKKSLYIAMDGSVPMGKIQQQRSRRHKAVLEYQFKKDLEKKYNVSLNISKWTSVSISPGTIFMNKLSKLIVKNIKEKIFKVPLITFSSDLIAGEGEAKIIPEIKKLRDSGENIVVYSPDADLIILTTMTNIPNIYILREVATLETIEKYSEFFYLNIDVCRKGFFDEITNKEFESSIIDPNRILADYTFLATLCGNDFVIHASFLAIRENGLELLIKIYKKIRATFNEYLLINNSTINLPFFRKIIAELKDIELEKCQKWQKNKDRIRKSPINETKVSNNETKVSNNETNDPEKTLLENTNDILTKFQHNFFYDPNHPQFEKYNKLFFKINYFDKDWISQYNNYYFPNEDINIVCLDYYKSLIFCLKYYNGLNENWSWSYKHRSNPTFADFHNWLSSNIDVSLEEASIFPKDNPYTPFEQLMMILPKSYLFLLPKVLNSDMEFINKMYQTSYDIDVLRGQKFIYSEPILPEIDSDLIKNYIKSKEHLLTNVEKNRNTLTKI